MSRASWVSLLLVLAPAPVACDGFTRLDPPADEGVYGFANGCYAVEGFDGDDRPGFAIKTDGGTQFSFVEPSAEAAAHFVMRPSDLGTYLFYDQFRRYLVAEPQEGSETGFRVGRQRDLASPLTTLEDGFRSPAEWELQPSVRDAARYQLKHYQTGLWLTLEGLTENEQEAAIFTFVPQDDCVDFPELSLDATGEVEPATWPDGDLYGMAEIHSHMFHNEAYGGGSTFHGAPFHRLGVEHALPDCSPWHGEDGKRDIVGFFFDGDPGELEVDALTPILLTGEVPDFNHHTAGYPGFTDWPNSWNKATHQTMYYRWLERAYLGGLRLVVQHATGNSILCELVTGIDSQVPLRSCNDMVSVDRQIEATRALERYIDAQHGGPGQGWLRIVESPEEAREVVAAGKLAMVLGIEISNLFNCFVTPREGFERCTPEDVVDNIEFYRDLGVRAIFPVHKFDNGFSAGDGHEGIIELGNIANTGHYSSFIEDCPGTDTSFDGTQVVFGGLNQPRADFFAPPVIDVSNFDTAPVGTLLPLIEKIEEPALEGEWCQSHGLTPLGEMLITELMKRGMMIDIAHLPQRSMERAYELMEAQQYPALKTHGSSNQGRLYATGGMRGTGFGRCAAPGTTGSLGDRLRDDVIERTAAGFYPAEALKFDLNGLAGGPRPRFGENSRCNEAQANPVSYPFTSYDGQVTFTRPRLGERQVDFNEEGMLHIGLLPELIEDARRDGMTDEELEPLFRSAEAFIRMWEAAEARGASL